MTQRARGLLLGGAGVAALLAAVVATWGDRREPEARPGAEAGAPADSQGQAVTPSASTAAPPRAKTPVPRAPASVAFGVFSDRAKPELKRLLDRKALGDRLGPKHCGDAAACDAVRRTLLDPERVNLDVADRKMWTMPKDIEKVALGLTKEEKDGIDRPGTVVVIQVRGDALPDQLPARTGFAITAAIAEQLKGLVHDQVCERIERPDSFARRTVTAPLGQSAFSRSRIEFQYTPRPDGTVRLVSVGLARFGTPDLAVETASLRVAERLPEVLAAVAKKLVDGEESSPVRLSLDDLEASRGAPFPEDAGASSAPFPVFVGLEPVKAKAGDPNPFMVRVIPDEGATPDGYRDLVEAFFPGGEDEEPSDTEIEAMRARTQQALPEAFSRADREGGRLYLHLPFELTDGGAVEYLWIAVESHDERMVTGTLLDEPTHLLRRKKGDRVTLPHKGAIEYLLEPADSGTP